MLYAVVARPPVFGGKVRSFDDAEALKVPGVVKVVRIEPPPIPSEFQPLGGVAVIARNTWAAMQGRDKLKIAWDDGPNAAYSSDSYRAELEAAARKPGKVVRDAGRRRRPRWRRPRSASRPSTTSRTSRSRPMEPPAALVRIVGGKCEAWACVQAPQATRTRLAKRLGLTEEDVTVNVTLLGGGFGRKSKPDFVIEAGLLSQAMDGAPVKVTWTREDDLHHGYLPHGLGRAARGRPRRQRHAGRLAASQRRADDRLDLRARSEARAALRARHGPRQHAVRDPEHPRPRTRRRSRMRASAGSGRCRTSRTPSRSSPSWPSSRMRRGATPRTTCSS